MSRSYKHSPVCCIGDRDRRDQKKLANRRVRRRKELYQFSKYKRLYEPWLIVEHRWFKSLKRFLNYFNELCFHYGKPYVQNEEVINWYRFYRRK